MLAGSSKKDDQQGTFDAIPRPSGGGGGGNGGQARAGTGRVDASIDFPGRCVPGQKFVVSSIPGIYPEEWYTASKRAQRMSISCVFFPDGSGLNGAHAKPCLCAFFYGPGDSEHADYHKWPDGKAPWGCLWAKRWQEKTQECVEVNGQQAVVIHKRGKVGNESADGLGGSQRGEVKWLKAQGYVRSGPPAPARYDIDELDRLVYCADHDLDHDACRGELPGAYRVGDTVYYLAGRETVSTGDKLVHGGRGEVVGPATLESHQGKGVKVRFPGNKGFIDIFLNDLSRQPPPTELVGGYVVGETVYYLGGSQTLPSGNKVVYGGRGEVVGPATVESHKGKGVAVQFPGNKGVVALFLNEVSRQPPPTELVGGYVVGQTVYYTGGSHTFPSGNKLVHGGRGEVARPATSESHKGKGLAVQFPGNKGVVDVFLNQVSRQPPPTELV